LEAAWAVSNDPTVAEFFGLGMSQAELDFVNVPANNDIPLFLDPFAISLRTDPWSQGCGHLVHAYFQHLVERIRAVDRQGALDLLAHLKEPNETRLGYSRGRSQGAGIGRDQSRALYEALSQSSAVQTGFINHLEETELMVEGVGRDKISDLTTNLLRGHLVTYTQEQCDLLGIPVRSVPLPPVFDLSRLQWESRYHDLPVTERGPLLLVPKAIVRYDASYNADNYYHSVVLEFLQAEELRAGSSLVHVLKSGKERVFKKDLEKRFVKTKEFLFEFSKDHPQVLAEYRNRLASLERAGIAAPVSDPQKAIIAAALIKAIRSIAPGSETASEYHRLMIGTLELLMFPDLLHPVKENEIHEGRKRIDIVMENGARIGTALYTLMVHKSLPCPYVPIECKNYTTEVGNPELDQLAGRFSPQRGKFGILCCRQFEDRDLFIQRCRDTLKDDRGLILPIDDSTLIRMLEAVQNHKDSDVDAIVGVLITEVWMA
jgi:hypothetical protein